MKDIDDIYDITNELIMCCNNVYVNTYTRIRGKVRKLEGNEHDLMFIMHMRGTLMKCDEYDMI